MPTAKPGPKRPASTEPAPGGAGGCCVSNPKKPGKARQSSAPAVAPAAVLPDDSPGLSAEAMRRRRNIEWARLAPDDTRRLAFEQPDATPAQRRQAAVAVRTLRGLGFPNPAIRRLVSKLRQLAGIADARSGWPTAGADRASLIAIRTQAAALRTALEGMYPMAAMHLAGGTHDLFDDELLTDNMESALAKLEQAASYAIERMPVQGRPPSHKTFVFAVLREADKLAEPMRPSASPSSRFHRACQAAFELAGLRRKVNSHGQLATVIPTAAIRAALGNRRPPK